MPFIQKHLMLNFMLIAALCTGGSRIFSRGVGRGLVIFKKKFENFFGLFLVDKIDFRDLLKHSKDPVLAKLYALYAKF